MRGGGPKIVRLEPKGGDDARRDIEDLRSGSMARDGYDVPSKQLPRRSPWDAPEREGMAPRVYTPYPNNGED
jgi:hypothetical protein